MGCGSSTAKTEQRAKQTEQKTQKQATVLQPTTKSDLRTIFDACCKTGGVACSRELAEAIEKSPGTIKTLTEENLPITYMLAHLKEQGDEEISWETLYEQLHDKHSLEALFARMDTNNDGALSTQELKKGLENEPDLLKIMEESHVPMKQVMEYFEEATEEIDIERFREILHHPTLEALFERADTDHNGFLSQQELSAALENDHALCEDIAGAGMSVQAILETLRREDQNQLSLEQLRNLIHDPDTYHNEEPDADTTDAAADAS